MQQNNEFFTIVATQLMPAPIGSFIISHQKRNSPTNHTYNTILIASQHLYSMFVVMDGPIRTQLNTNIKIRGIAYAQIIHIQSSPHTHNISGRTSHRLFIALGTQALAPIITLSKYSNRKIDKLCWALVLLHNTIIPLSFTKMQFDNPKTTNNPMNVPSHTITQ
jgi:hypothetical protein